MPEADESFLIRVEGLDRTLHTVVVNILDDDGIVVYLGHYDLHEFLAQMKPPSNNLM